jgi:hypothetical protein
VDTAKFESRAALRGFFIREIVNYGLFKLADPYLNHNISHCKRGRGLTNVPYRRIESMPILAPAESADVSGVNLANRRNMHPNKCSYLSSHADRISVRRVHELGPN